ncbi:hypothetical protein MKW94_028046 [Papaver nudicaule]|uniref:C3H1-type domain-containing protein n=1 Tax=Papaver nudicaule TaxID=74823 RepID=A0AA41VBY9_PAPNU|nr:hypothetical protein [Papaver nudicaule]
MYRGIHPSFIDLSEAQLAEILSTTNLLETGNSVYIDGDVVYNNDEFRMFIFKIKKCPKTRSHDWTECPYAHRNEKARRRDPRKFRYSGIACSEFRSGECKNGELCEFAHGIFEFWLHPSRYRTRLCNAGMFCRRKVCFFAHSVEQLRPETKYKAKNSCHSKNEKSNVVGSIPESSSRIERRMVYSQQMELVMMRNEYCQHPWSIKEDWEFLDNFRGLKIEEEEEDDDDDDDDNEGNRQVVRNFSYDVPEFTPDIDWVSELVN